MNTSATTVEEYLETLPEWQRENLSLFRSLILDADGSITEAIKWGVPTFLRGKELMFAMSAFKAHTKFNFIRNGAFLDDPKHLFNNGLESKKARAIDTREGERIDTDALELLVQASVTRPA